MDEETASVATEETSAATVETPQDGSNETVEPQARSKPAGYDPVDLSDLPPERQKEISDRLDYMYKQIKGDKRERAEAQRALNEYRQVAAQQAQLLSELQGGMGMVVDHLTVKQLNESESNLKAQMQVALDSGDTKTYVDAQARLLEITAQKLVKPQNPQRQQTETQRQAYAGQQIYSASQIGSDAMAGGELEIADLKYVEAWQNETDDSGNPLRPWASNVDTRNPSPQAQAALREAAAVFTNPAYSRMTIQQKMAEVDKRMGVQRSSSGQTVMGGSLTNRSKNTKITLSPKQAEIALKTKFGGPKAKSDADHLEAYRKQVEKLSKGAR
jgi:hypothetical protein